MMRTVLRLWVTLTVLATILSAGIKKHVMLDATIRLQKRARHHDKLVLPARENSMSCW